MKLVTSEGTNFKISFPYDQKIVTAVKKLSTRRFDSVSKIWDVPLSCAREVAAFAEENGFELSAAAAAAIARVNENFSSSNARETELVVEGLGGELLPFQRAGVAYAARNRRCFIADEMGLGKTVQALATIHATNAYPAVIVCPASLKLNWQRECKKWLPTKSVAVLNGKTADYSADIIIINYDILKKHMNGLLSIRPEAVVFDESHYCKNHKALRTRTARTLATGWDADEETGERTQVYSGASVRLALTGTPVLNRPNELLSQLSILGRLDDLGGFWGFAKRYCGAHRGRFGWDFSGATNLSELNEKLRASCYVRRLKKDVLPELPAKQRAVVPLEIDNRREYTAAQSDLISFLKNEAQEDRVFYARIAHLSHEEQRAERDARANSARNAEHLVRVEMLKQLAAQGKLAAVREWIESFLETGESLVVFAHHKKIVDELSAAFNAPSITGETPLELRQQYVDEFQAGKHKLIVLNIQAGGVGLTLTKASNVAFVELAWTPAAHDQAEDRCHRIGQSDSVTAWYLVAPNTIDETIYTLLAEKRQVVDAATDGAGGDAGGILNALIEELTKK